MNVRQATTNDAGAILQIHRRVLEEGTFFITRPHEFRGSIYGVVQHIRELNGRANSRFLVVESEQEVCGFVTARGGELLRMAHTAKVEIMIRAEDRGKGFGRALMQHCLDWARDTPSVEKLGLSVYATNAPAYKMYQSLGFLEEGRRVNEYKMTDGSYRDDVLMYCDVR